MSDPEKLGQPYEKLKDIEAKRKKRIEESGLDVIEGGKGKPPPTDDKQFDYKEALKGFGRRSSDNPGRHDTYETEEPKPEDDKTKLPPLEP